MNRTNDRRQALAILPRVLLAIYRYLPLPLYACLWLGYWLLPLARRSLEPRLAMKSLPPRGRRAIWFHAASVGEISTIAPVVAEVRALIPGTPIVVTTMTRSGARRAGATLKYAEVALVPYDFLPSVRRFVSALEPSCLVIGETEIWPNLVAEAKRQGIPVVLVNGRISERSYPRYRLIRPFMKGVLASFDLFLMRTEIDATRMISLGAEPERVEVAGNTKYDILPAPLDCEARRAIRRDLAIGEATRVVTFGSAREGECEIVLKALVDSRIGSLARLVIAPRHLELVPQVEQVCRSVGLSSITLAELRLPPSTGAVPEVLILAQMGRLLETYAISDIAIVGGTFRPFGGHNPLEPASQGCVTMVGPHIQNIKDDIRYLTSRSCAFVVTEADLGETVARVLSRDDQRNDIGRAAIRAVEEKKGIAKKCVEAMLRRHLLPGA